MLYRSNETKIDNKRICWFYWYSHILISRKPVGPPYYKAMLKFKEKSLKYNKGYFNPVMKLSEDTFHEISWQRKEFIKVV